MRLYSGKGEELKIQENSISSVTTDTGVDITINGNTYSINNGTATDEQVSAWLDAHPEATTSVQDNAIDYNKLSMTEYSEDNANVPIESKKTEKMIYYYYGATKNSIDETTVKTFCGSNVEYKVIDATNITEFKIRAYRTKAVYQNLFVYALNNLQESAYEASPSSVPNKAYQLAEISFTDNVTDTTISVDSEYPYIIIGIAQTSTALNKCNFDIVDGWYVNNTSSPTGFFKVITDKKVGKVLFKDDKFIKAVGKASKGYYEETETEIFIAAADSTDGDKNRATFICSGTNDELVVQQALDRLEKKGGVITLLNGNYYFDSFTTVGDYGKFCIYVKDNNYQRNILIQGTNSPVRKYGGQPTVNTAIINITSTALNMIDGTEPQTCVIGLASLTQRCKYPSYTLGVHKIGFNFDDNQHKVICVNGEMFSQMLASDLIFNLNVKGSGTDDASGIPLAAEGFIALRGLVGGNFGNGYLLENMFAFGFDCAYDLGGEHLIAKQLGCRYCNYSYRFNYYGNSGIHPITLINCCDEASIYGPYFSSRGASRQTQSVSFYDYNSECHMTGTYAKQKYAYMENSTDFNGIVTYRFTNATSWTLIDRSFFEDGCGAKYKQINMPFISN